MFNQPPQTVVVKLKQKAEKFILQGHPWIFETSIDVQKSEGKPGDIAVIFAQRDNRLLAIGLLDPTSPIRIKVLSVRKKLTINQAFFDQRMEAAYEKRKDLLKSKTNAYRLIFGENDEMPSLVIDIYDHIAVVKLYALIWVPYLDYIIESLKKINNVDTCILRLNRIVNSKIGGDKYKDGQILFGTLEDPNVDFFEHGMIFRANVIKGHKTGYFLDHRHNRLAVRSLSQNKHVLDIFSYAGGFSVNALQGGAKSVSSVDISKQALGLIKDNIALNQLDINKHIPLHGDAFDVLTKLKDENKKYELIIVDPPSFAKKEEEIPRAINSYKRLLLAVLPLIRKDGIVLMASCSSRIQMDDYILLIKDTLAEQRMKYEIIKTTRHDIDHPELIPELSYLKSVYVKVG